VILVDSNIPMYLVGAEHPNKAAARRILETAIAAGERLVTDAEVFQEILHRYVAIDRREAIEPAFDVLLDIVDAVRAVWPAGKPLFVRLSATDWAPGGWDADQTVQLSSLLRRRGVDLVDVSSGGTVVTDIPVAPGYQVPFADRVRREAGVATGAVGLIVSPQQAEQIRAAGHRRANHRQSRPPVS